jgi:hypothetical protein
MIYVVLGMHKSGTTLVAEVLHASGIDMVEGSYLHLSYDQGNKYERASTAALNREILDTQPFADGFTSLDLPAPQKLSDTAELRSRIRSLVDDLNRSHRHWGFKDPRTCWTYPVWGQELPEHRIVAIYRAPDEIWPRYRDPRRLYRNPYRAWRFLLRWCEYNSAIATCLQRTDASWLVLSYRELMETQAEFDRLQEFVGSNLEDRRVADLRRNRPGNSPLLKAASYLAQRLAGYSPERLVDQFEALRQQAISPVKPTGVTNPVLELLKNSSDHGPDK